MNYKYIIVGAGLAGAVSARTLAEKGHKVMVIERSDHIAGHCHDYKNDAGITTHTYGPHIFHTKNKEIWNWVKQYADFIYFQHRVLSYANGQLLPFPINRDTISQLFGVELTINEVEEFLKHEVEISTFNEPPKNFRDAVVAQVGETLYTTFFENYTKKQWERDPSELSAELAKRIPVRTNRDDRYFADQYQGIPSKGYTSMVGEMLNHENISIMLNTDYFKVKDSFSPSMTIYTGELDAFFDYQFGKLEYRSLRLEFKTLDTKEYQQAAVVNYPNDYDWTRITEFKKLSGEKSDKTTLCFEFPKATGEPYYIVPDEKNTEMRKKYMELVENLEKEGKFLFIGRLAEYTYYNMDQVIEAALNKIASIDCV